MNTVERYLEVFESLRARKRWSTDSTILRFAALTLAATTLDDPGARLEETAKALQKKSGSFSPMSSPIRHVVAAMILRRGFDPEMITGSVKETLKGFKKHRLRKSGPYATLSALLLVFDAGGRAVDEATVARMKAILGQWNEDHWFLTGIDDYPMAALHAARGADPSRLGVEVELIYKTLREQKFSRGNQLQLVSHLLMLAPFGPREAAMRFGRMAAALKRRGQKVRSQQYDETALLVLAGERVDSVSAKVVAYRDRLREAKPRPQASLAFSLATGLVLAEQAAKAEGVTDAAAASQLQAAQAVIEAQQAALVACIAATTVATSVATTAG